ncbi:MULTISPECIES: DUF1617 family protein [Gemella]|uniref:DUF1617 family protein n=1 Tax=Gemella TaxID=1378 RepID=UPI000767E805|nr:MULTISPECIES: DUF1617 family protein [Gemella]AME09655.1 hypothetical protein AXE85_05575 [Gemella sp. oral taxon 928]AXI27256.1 DUF1617 domain-containing protein [Gemella sp. ND 6198]
MELKIQNKDLEILLQTVSNLPIKKMKANRGRAKFLKKLQEKLETYIEDRTELAKVYVEYDKDQPKVDSDGNLIYKDNANVDEFIKELNELNTESVIIQGGEYSERYTDFFNDLLELEVELSAYETILIDDILEQFEKGDKE